MKSLLLLFLLSGPALVFGQHTFDLKDASKYFDVKLTVAKCGDGFCEGKAQFQFFKKGSMTPYQTINLPETSVQLEDDGKPLTNVSLMYDKQSVVNVGDFNFDGMEDVALCDGTNGGYGGPSYQVYLSSRQLKRFVRSPGFTRLGQGPYLGMFEVDAKQKRLSTFSKSGCCMHFSEEYDVVNGRPRKIKEVNEYYNTKGDGMVETETKILVRGKWRTSVKRERAKDGS